MGYKVAWNECIVISCALCHGDSFYETSLTPILRREQLIIFISRGDIRSHANSSEISEILAGKSPVLFCLFHAVLIMIVQKPNTFFKDLLHLFVRKLFLHVEEATLHLQWENLCWTCEFLVAFELKTIKLRPRGFRNHLIHLVYIR